MRVWARGRGVLEECWMRGAFARLLVVLAALMVLPGSAWGGVLYRCQMSGRVQSTCCCGAREKAPEPGAVPGACASDCCERLVPRDGLKATNPRTTNDSIQPSAFVPALSVHPPVRVAQAPERAPSRSRAPPGPRRPLFVVHCAYLC